MAERSEKKAVLAHFQKNCPQLSPILSQINFDDWFNQEILDSNLIFKSLCRTIVGQQLAGKAADAIYGRFENLLENNVTPERLLELNPESIRSVGLSWAKVRSVIDLSDKIVRKELILESLVDLNDEELIVELSKVKGIGRWTAEMFLMFRLGREDIFSWGDLGLKNGLKKFLNNPDLSLEEMNEVVEKWKPYRSYGAIAMWHLLDNR